MSQQKHSPSCAIRWSSMVRLEDIPRYLDFRHFDPVAEDHMTRFAYMVSITLHFLSSAYLPCRYLDEQGTGGQWSRTTLVPLARQLRWIVHGQDQDLRMRLSYIGTSRACLHACMQVAGITAWGFFYIPYVPPFTHPYPLPMLNTG